MEDEVQARNEHAGQQRQGQSSGLAAELRDGTLCSTPTWFFTQSDALILTKWAGQIALEYQELSSFEL